MNKLFYWIAIIIIEIIGAGNVKGQNCNYDYILGNQHPFEIDSAIVYSNADNPPFEWNCTDSILEYDVYYPADYDFNSKPPLPAVFVIHGGGFQDGSNRSKTAEYCEKFAGRNFVAINIGYRTGLNDVDSCTTTTKMFATYRAVQDVRGAIRKVVADQKSNPPLYRIDTSSLYVGGLSAGAIVALLVAYYDQKDINKALPAVSMCLGGINDPSHYLPKKNKEHFKIAGAFSLSGAIFKSLTAIQPGDPPVIMFHGEKDKLVPFYFETEPFCTSPDLASPCNCPGFTMPPGSEPTFGPDSMDFRFKKLHICYELYHDPEGGHTLTNSDYGLGIVNPDTAKTYIVERVCCFFKSVKCGTCSFNPTQVDFKDEVNNTCDGYSLKASLPLSYSSSFYEISWDNQWLQLYFNSDSGYNVEVRSLDGRFISSQSGYNNFCKINLSNTPSGIYVVRILHGGNFKAEKILKLW